MDERRKVTRLKWSKGVILIKDGKRLDCTTSEISVKNALITINEKVRFNVNEVVQLIIKLSDNDTECQIEVKVEVKRIVSENQIAVVFLSLDLDSFAMLKEILIHNFGDDIIISNDIKKIFSQYMEN